ncbi:MAG: hypothetical protein V4692_06460 [Bdellovibrionota bacterium]
MLILTALLPLFAATSQGQSLSSERSNDRQPSQLVCSLSMFFSFDADDVVGNVVHIEGRGLTTCKNDQGFSTEAPVFADLDAKIDGQLIPGETAFSANASTFVIPREIGQIADVYETRSFSWNENKAEPVAVLRGRKHDLVLELKLNSVTSTIELLNVEGVRIRFDDTAPDFQ